MMKKIRGMMMRMKLKSTKMVMMRMMMMGMVRTMRMRKIWGGDSFAARAPRLELRQCVQAGGRGGGGD